MPTQEIAALAPKSLAIPGNVVDTETCSKELKKIAKMRESITTKSFFAGIRDD
jgi:hypothetical protein